MIIPSTEFVAISMAIFAGSLALDWLIGGLALKHRDADARPSLTTSADEASGLQKAA